MKSLMAVIGVVALTSLPGVAAAAQLNWTLSGSLIEPGQGLTSDACGGTVKCELNFTSNNQTLSARFYSAPSLYSNNTYAGSFIAGEIARFSGGLGGKNLVTGDIDEGANPEHAIDNQQVVDVLVLEAPTNDFKWESLGLGWYSGDSDVQVYVGNGAADLNFTTMCFTGCGSSAANRVMDSFTNLGLYKNVVQAGDAPNPIDLTKTASGASVSATGRYLVVSGALSSGYTGNDQFKVSSAGGYLPPSTSVPLPSTLALLIPGILGLWRLSRRSAVSA